MRCGIIPKHVLVVCIRVQLEVPDICRTYCFVAVSRIQPNSLHSTTEAIIEYFYTYLLNSRLTFQIYLLDLKINYRLARNQSRKNKMSDSEGSDDQLKDLLEIKHEIQKYKSDPATSGMFVSGWDDADEDVDIVADPKGNPIDHALWAAENGKTSILKQLLSSQPSLLHVQDSDGYTMLHRAAYGNHLDTISYLLSVGADVGIRTELGWTPLHSACKWNNYQAVARLLAGGADPTALSDGAQTPMHLTSAISHCKSTLLILLLREDISEIAKMPNNSGETPEQLAQRNGIYAPLFEMISPAVSYIKSLAFTCNPYVRDTLHS